MLVIRGPLSTVDVLRDATLFSRVAMMQFAGWMVPISHLLPTAFQSRVMRALSRFEGLIETAQHDRFDAPVFEYALSLLTDKTRSVNISAVRTKSGLTVHR